MAEESEKRFHAIMDKLFQAPPPPNSNSKSTNTTSSASLSRVGLLRDKKRPYTVTTTLAASGLKSRGVEIEELRSVSNGTMQAPMCRPWDRGDLLKRLATFKSMTWFAKPEVVNAINCACRGWVNVDMDIIACESCGARLLFSTPSSWPQQQVEKAALVFSLKLSSGHKLLCPWVDNACDEKLAQFPPTTLADLVDSHKKRCALLLQLSALPVISSSAVDYMMSPQLEHFLKSPSTPEHIDKSDHVSATECLGDEGDKVLSLYYQAQKLISLCGWEPRLLPYIVDCKGIQDKSAKGGTLVDPSAAVSNSWTSSISVYSSGYVENMEANEDSAASGNEYDPASVVLDCGLCGASVGLWTFCTTPRPVEFIRFTGHSEIHYEDKAARQTDKTDLTIMVTSGIHAESSQHIASTAKTGTTSSNGTLLNLTIAGGPPPAEQNFRPIISLPVVGRNLRTRFSSAFKSRDDDYQHFKASSQGTEEHKSNALSLQNFLPQDMRLIEGKTDEDAHHGSTSNKLVEAVGEDTSGHVSLEGASLMETVVLAANKTYPTTRNQPENSDGIIESFSTGKKTSEDLASIEIVNPIAGDLCTSEAGGSYFITQGTENTENDKQVVSQGCGVQTVVQPMSSSSAYLGKDQKQQSDAKTMQFDPIRQHRHFCPWIASSGKSAPGWKQTLSALERQKEFFYPSTEQASSSLIEVDDPIASVKKLLTLPSSKRKKLTHGTSQNSPSSA